MVDLPAYVAAVQSFFDDDPLTWDAFSLAVFEPPPNPATAVTTALALTPRHGPSERMRLDPLVDLALADDGGAGDGGPAWLIEQPARVVIFEPNGFLVGHAATVERAASPLAMAVHRNEAKALNSLVVRARRGRDPVYFELDELAEFGIPPHQEPLLPIPVARAIDSVMAEVSGEADFAIFGLAVIAATTGFEVTAELLKQPWPTVDVRPGPSFA